MFCRACLIGICCVTGVCVASLPAAGAVLFVNDFQDGTTQGWGRGLASASVSRPKQVPDGGPLGIGDGYLSSVSVGSGEAGRQAVTNSLSAWKGNYSSIGIGAVELDLKNFGAADLKIRVMLRGFGGDFISEDFIDLPAGSDWKHGRISLEESRMIAGTGGSPGSHPPGINFTATIMNVQEIRLIHNPIADYPPPLIVSDIGIDNITAVEVPEPTSLAFTCAGLVGAIQVMGTRRRGLKTLNG